MAAPTPGIYGQTTPQPAQNAPAGIFQGSQPIDISGAANPNNIQTSIAGGGQIANSVQPYGTIQNTLNTSNVPSLVGGDQIQGSMMQAQNAAYNQAASRLNPQFDQQSHDLQNQLAQKGIMEGSDAYAREMQNFNMGKNDAYQTAQNNAVTQGNAAQAQLYGQGLSSNQNAFNQATTAAQFANNAQAQGFGQNLSGAQLANAAQAQQFGQNATQAQFGNSAQAQSFGQNAAQAQQDLANRNSQNALTLGQGSLANQATANTNALTLGQGSLANQATANQNALTLGQGGLANQATATQNALDLGQGALANQSTANQNALTLGQGQLTLGQGTLDQQKVANANQLALGQGSLALGNNSLQAQIAQNAALNGISANNTNAITNANNLNAGAGLGATLLGNPVVTDYLGGQAKKIWAGIFGGGVA